jgi:CRISPR-associated protein Cmr1
MTANYTAPALKRRNEPVGGAKSRIELQLEVVTPILGGGAVARELDDIDFIRVPAIRGHLRFWWRALCGHEFESASELYKAESALWGSAAGNGGRSQVEIRINVQSKGEIDESRIRLYDSKDGKATAGAYALFPARDQKNQKPIAPRRKPGTRFQLIVDAPKERESEIRETVQAWVIFGGYGSRTRRGLGSLSITKDGDAWLPTAPTRDALTACLRRDVFEPVDRKSCDTPWLAGSSLIVGPVANDAVKAWMTALDWLKEFRQGTRGESPARQPEAGNRPSISNWPEADKIRRLTGKTSAHHPRYNAVPAWPRAGFGLPIIGQFQTGGRNGQYLDEPGNFALKWRDGKAVHERLASALIVKAMPLANGQFASCALWLNRCYPDGEVILLMAEREVSSSAAPFDRLIAEGDKARFSALDGKSSLREAFFHWLLTEHHTIRVA